MKTNENVNTFSDLADTKVVRQAKVFLSLNGIFQPISQNSISYFEKNVLQKVVPNKMLSFWFSRQVFDNILNLLEKEGATGQPAYGDTDGVRIYLLADEVDNSDLSISVVSTRYLGDDPRNPGNALHEDYYDHESHPLFDLAQTDWKKNTDDCKGGALLYTPCPAEGCPENNCGIDPAHEITRTYAVKMVDNFGSGKISTKGVWFNYKMFANLSNLSFTGIRVYLGNYGTTDTNGRAIPGDMEGGYYKRKRRDSVILITTKTVGDVELDSFDCVKIDKSKNFPFLDGYDNGELCPNHCN